MILSSIHHDTSHSVEVVECTCPAGMTQHVRANVQERDCSFVASFFGQCHSRYFYEKIPFAHLPYEADAGGRAGAAARTFALTSTRVLRFLHQM